MRYKEGEVPAERLAANASDDMLVLTAIIGVFVGIVLVVLGRYGKQLWMRVWGAGLVIISIYMGVSIKYDVTLFEYF